MDTTQSSTDKSIADKSTIESLRDHLAAANTHAVDVETQHHISEAIDCAAELPPTPLIECPDCGRVGLPERIAAHDC